MSVGGAGGVESQHKNCSLCFRLLQRSGWNACSPSGESLVRCHRLPSAPECWWLPTSPYDISVSLANLEAGSSGTSGLGVRSLGRRRPCRGRGHPLTLALMQPAFCSSSTLSLPPVLGEYCSALLLQHGMVDLGPWTDSLSEHPSQ